jgi:hypothetical protein
MCCTDDGSLKWQTASTTPLGAAQLWEQLVNSNCYRTTVIGQIYGWHAGTVLDGTHAVSLDAIAWGRLIGRHFRGSDTAAASLSYLSLPTPPSPSIVWGVATEYIFYCKRAILFLSYSKILTPPPPSLSPPGESVLPPQQRRGVHTRRAERGMGGQYFGRRER